MNSAECLKIWATIHKNLEQIRRHEKDIQYAQYYQNKGLTVDQERAIQATREYVESLWDIVKYYYCSHREELNEYLNKCSDEHPTLSYWRSVLERVINDEANSALESALSQHS